MRTHSLGALAIGILLSDPALGADRAYDPLAVGAGRLQTLDLVVADGGRQREIPLRVYLGADTSRAPVVLFSHGLGGSREASAYLGSHWASAATSPSSSSTRAATRPYGVTCHSATGAQPWNDRLDPSSS